MTFLVGVNPGRARPRRCTSPPCSPDPRTRIRRRGDRAADLAHVRTRGGCRVAGVPRQTANVVLDHAAAVLGDSVKAEYLLHEASSARRGLLELVDERGCDLVVVGSSSAGPLGRIALGSESDALVHASHVPVAIAPRGFRTRRRPRRAGDRRLRRDGGRGRPRHRGGRDRGAGRRIAADRLVRRRPDGLGHVGDRPRRRAAHHRRVGERHRPACAAAHRRDLLAAATARRPPQP